MDQRTHAEDADSDTADAADADPDPGARESTTCARCGTAHEGRPVTWTCSVENGVREFFCVGCARANLRSIEGRIDSAWW